MSVTSTKHGGFSNRSYPYKMASTWLWNAAKRYLFAPSHNYIELVMWYWFIWNVPFVREEPRKFGIFMFCAVVVLNCSFKINILWHSLWNILRIVIEVIIFQSVVKKCKDIWILIWIWCRSPLNNECTEPYLSILNGMPSGSRFTTANQNRDNWRLRGNVFEV